MMTVLTSRFLLDLQDVNVKATSGRSGSISGDYEITNTQDTLFFARAVGSIGAHIESREYMDEVDEG